MVGYVFTFDEFGNLHQNHEGVKITVFGKGDNYSASSDESGRFHLKNLLTGTYEIHFEKKGYGILKQFSIQHLGGQATLLGLNNNRVYFIYEMPTTEISNLVLNKDTAYAEFQFSKGPAPQYINLRLYFSNNADFTEDSQKYNADFKIGVNGPNWHKWRASGLPFNPGSTVYYKAAINTKVSFIYPDDYYIYQFSEVYRLSGISTYFDINDKKTINPNIGDETEVYSFVFPD